MGNEIDVCFRDPSTQKADDLPEFVARLSEHKDRMKPFIGAKVILAEPMDEVTFLLWYKKADPKEMENRETRPGFHVLYPDNYHSWSPREVFIQAYRELSAEERFMSR